MEVYVIAPFPKALEESKRKKIIENKHTLCTVKSVYNIPDQSMKRNINFISSPIEHIFISCFADKYVFVMFLLHLLFVDKKIMPYISGSYFISLKEGNCLPILYQQTIDFYIKIEK